MSDFHYEYKGYRYYTKRKFLQASVEYSHFIECPDGKTINLSFDKNEECESLSFRHWVDLQIGTFDIEYQKHKYHPIRLNGWHLGLATYRHEVTLPNGATIIAGFRVIDIAQPEYFGNYVDFGLPCPQVFGLQCLTSKFLRDLKKLSLEYNVDPLDHMALAVLLKLAA